MEALTRLVSESLARHGFDRPLDYRRLQWSRWFRCDSPHSLLQVPSKPGVFALADEIIHVAADAFVRPSEQSSDASSPESRRMLAVSQFFETDDMAFVLDRMLSRQNPMRARLASGRYFVRFVVIEDESQRRSICSALNQWIVNSAEKATGIGSHFATSLELAPQTEETAHGETAVSAVPPKQSEAASTPAPAKEILSSERGKASLATTHVGADPFVRPAEQTEAPPLVNPALAVSTPTTPLNSGAATNIPCPFPSGFLAEKGTRMAASRAAAKECSPRRKPWVAGK